MTRREIVLLVEALNEAGLKICSWDGSTGYGPPYWRPATQEELERRMRAFRRYRFVKTDA